MKLKITSVNLQGFEDWEARHEKRILIGDFNITHLEEASVLWENDYKSTTVVPYVT